MVTPPKHPIRILFVCYGNICRSPIAEVIMAKCIEAQGLSDSILTDSAGVLSYHSGELPEKRMRDHASRRGYTMKHRARQVCEKDFYQFDYIFVMDNNNLKDVRAVMPDGETKAAIHLMLSFAKPNVSDNQVPDPYYGGPKDFENVIDLCEEACPLILQHILKEKIEKVIEPF